MLGKSILLLSLLLGSLWSTSSFAGSPPALICDNANLLGRWSSCDFEQAIRGDAGFVCFEGDVTTTAKALSQYSEDGYFSNEIYWQFSADKSNNKIHVWFNMSLGDIRWSNIIPFCQNF